MRFAFLLILVLASHSIHAEEAPTRVLVVGVYHFANPGQDVNNIEADDVLAPQRQKELKAVTDALARFEPNKVAVEWSAEYTDEQYAKYRSGSEPSRNEVEQLGFRLAVARGIERVFGVDVAGDFPYEPVQEWAKAHPDAGHLAAIQKDLAEFAEGFEQMQKEKSIGGLLRVLNDPKVVERVNEMYGEALRYGEGDDQPGVALNAAWAERNYGICARLIQTLKPGDRAVVFYGAGHLRWLWRCLDEIPGIVRVDALEYLPE